MTDLFLDNPPLYDQGVFVEIVERKKAIKKMKFTWTMHTYAPSPFPHFLYIKINNHTGL